MQKMRANDLSGNLGMGPSQEGTRVSYGIYHFCARDLNAEKNLRVTFQFYYHPSAFYILSVSAILILQTIRIRNPDFADYPHR
jgi:hypothetical protein